MADLIGTMRVFPDAWLTSKLSSQTEHEVVLTPLGKACARCKQAILPGDVGMVVCVGVPLAEPIEEAVLHRGCFDAIVADLKLG